MLWRMYACMSELSSHYGFQVSTENIIELCCTVIQKIQHMSNRIRYLAEEILNKALKV